jgi:hypothetical protein
LTLMRITPLKQRRIAISKQMPSVEFLSVS